MIGDYERTAADSMTTLLRTDPSIVLVLRRRVRQAGGTAHFPAAFDVLLQGLPRIVMAPGSVFGIVNAG